ncbi:MAG: hypothetical protein M3328_15290 [Chloroflexota bacterium]|nr:hypothetical protein [Chloroflexota bacterium]
MENNSGVTPGPGAAPPSPALDPNATRYLPPQQPYNPQPEVRSTAQQPYAARYNSAPAFPPAPQVLPAGYPPQGRQRDRDRTVLGLILVGGGILFLLDQFSPFTSFGDLVLLLLGGIFMYAYFTTRPGYRIGFLIPGSILLGLGAGQALTDLPFSWFFGETELRTLTLGLGFCMIWFFERKHWWFLIPGGILILSGLSSLASSIGASIGIGSLWPVALIALGAYLLFDQSRRHHQR